MHDVRRDGIAGDQQVTAVLHRDRHHVMEIFPLGEIGLLRLLEVLLRDLVSGGAVDGLHKLLPVDIGIAVHTFAAQIVGGQLRHHGGDGAQIAG